MSYNDVIRIINHYQNLENNFVNISKDDVLEVKSWIDNGLVDKDELYIKMRDYGII